MLDPITLGVLVAALVIVLILVALLFHRAPVKRVPQQGPSAAMLALARGERSRALQILRGCVDQPDVAVETMLVLGHLLREHGETERALQVHHALLGRSTLKPDQRRLIELQIVDDLLVAEQIERAEDRLAQLDEHYEDEEILERRATTLVRLQRREDAVEVLTRLAALDEGDGIVRARAANGIAEIAREQFRAGDVSPAARTAQAALDLDSTRPAAYAVLGDTRAAVGETDGAVDAWMDALRKTDDAGPYVLGRILEAVAAKGPPRNPRRHDGATARRASRGSVALAGRGRSPPAPRRSRGVLRPARRRAARSVGAPRRVDGLVASSPLAR